MNDITFKIARKGEGKTKWLIEVAHRCYKEFNDTVYLFTEDDNSYVRFCEKYFKTYFEVCPVQKLPPFVDPTNSIILVDNLLECNCQTNNFKFMQRNCKKMYVTLEGMEDTLDVNV